jgi:cytochrome P450
MSTSLTGAVAVPELSDVADPGLLDELLGATHASDPYPTYQRLQRNWPVWRHFGAVGLMRYDDIDTVLRHPQVSVDDRNSRQHNSMAAERELGPGYLSQMDRRSFLHRDPPDHTRLRRLVAKAFTSRRVEQLRPFVRRFVAEVLEGAGRARRIELIGQLAYPLPIAVICRLLGVPPEDRAIVESWPRAQLCCSFEPASLRDDAREAGQAEADRIQQQLGDYFDHLIARRRAAPRDDPALAGAAVEETLRYDAPFQFTRRVALTDIDVGGYRIPRAPSSC